MLEIKLTHFYKLRLTSPSRKNFWAAMICFTLLLTSCKIKATPSMKEVDTSFLTDDPCAAPCWYGIKLYETDKEEVYEILEQLLFVQHESIREIGGVWKNDNQARFISYHCSYTDSTCGEIVIAGDWVQHIWFKVGFGLTLENVVQKLNYPDYTSIIPGSGERVSCIRTLYWSKKNIFIESYDNRACPTLIEIKSGVGIERGAMVDTIFYGFQQETWPLIDQGGPYLQWSGFSD